MGPVLPGRPHPMHTSPTFHDAIFLGKARVMRRSRWRQGLGFVAVLGSLLALGCGTQGDGSPPPYISTATNKSPYPPPATGACDTGAKQFCSITIEHADGLHSCWQGVQYCVDGFWGPCGDLEEAPPNGLGGASSDDAG